MAYAPEISDEFEISSDEDVIADSTEELAHSEIFKTVISDSDDEKLSNSKNASPSFNKRTNESSKYKPHKIKHINRIMDSDSDEEITQKSFLKNSKEESRNDRFQRQINPVATDSEEENIKKVAAYQSNSQNNSSMISKQVNVSFTKTRSKSNSSDSEEEKIINKIFIKKDLFDVSIKKKTDQESLKTKLQKKNMISSDSDDDDDDNRKMLDENMLKTNVITSDKDNDKKFHAIRSSQGENIDNATIHQLNEISIQLENSRISQDFGSKKLLCSTFVDPGNFSNTPTNKETGKRLLNKSIETPRVFKQIKENTTPRLEKEDCPQFFNTRETTQIILSDSEDSSDDIIDVSDEASTVQSKNKSKNVKQPTILDMFNKKSSVDVQNTSQSLDGIIEVSKQQYQKQEDMLKKLEVDLTKTLKLIKVINLEHLPDKGESLLIRQRDLQAKQLEETKKFSRMKVTFENESTVANLQAKPKILSWKDIENAAGKVQPNTFGKKAMSTYNAQKSLTIDRLQQLHGSLQTSPKETDLAEPPKGLKVELMLHQKRALLWLMWRENQKPSGGILADDMGLGKTLTMISLMLKCNENKKHDNDDEDDDDKKEAKYNGGTLVICPASLLNQWSGELERRTMRGLASCEVYHGTKREINPKRLAQHDMVVTTYSIVNKECEKKGAIFRVKWRRIIIDEAHQIRNYKSQTSDAVCRLSAKSRWALTGTPVHNKELDLYALLKFLRCSPFDDIVVWKRWVSDKSTGGTERLHTVISSLMLRRTKPELIEKGLLKTMPERKWELITVDLTKNERDVYSKILIFSRTLFAQFLHQRAEKNQEIQEFHLDNPADEPNKEYFLMRQRLLKLNKLRDIKQHEILVLLLRLRQICNHPSLITGMLDEDMSLMGDEENDDKEALNLLDQLSKLGIEEKEEHNSSQTDGNYEEAPTLREVVKNVLSPSDPIFSKTRMSSKIKAVIKILSQKVIPNKDKAIIVSQWPSFLDLIGYHLKEENIQFDKLDGKVPVFKRMEMVDRLNNPKDPMKILLLSLTAGGVGLNLVGANHLILLDLHWNPQLENQAQDRIYRVGQEKPVFVYKLMATDTIEKRILDLQEKKLDIAESMLTGSVQASRNKLSLNDLKMLFEM